MAPVAKGVSSSRNAKQGRSMKRLVITEDDDSSDEDDDEEDLRHEGTNDNDQRDSVSKMKKLVVEIDDDESDDESDDDDEVANADNKDSGNSYVMVGSQTNHDPSRIAELKKEAKAFFQSEHYQNAFEKFAEAFANIPPMTDEEEDEGNYPFLSDACALHNNMALCFIKMENFQGVITECSKTLQMHERLGPIDQKMVIKALLRRGAAFEALGEWQKALDDMCKVMGASRTVFSPLAKAHLNLVDSPNQHKNLMALRQKQQTR